MAKRPPTPGVGPQNENTKTVLISLMVRETLRQNTVTITTSATKIPTSALTNRMVLNIINISSNVVYIGDSTVTTSNGFPIYPRAEMRIEVDDNIDVYGIAGSSSEIRIIEGA